MKKYALIVLGFIVSLIWAQDIQIQMQPIANNEYNIFIKGKIQPQEKWFIFSLDSNDLYASRIQILNENVRLLSIDNITHFITQEKDTILQTTIKYFTDSIMVVLHIKYKDEDETLKLKIIAFINNAGNYESKEIDLRYIIKSPQPNTSITTDISSLHDEKMSMVLLFILAFLGGLFAVLTPCVYSMLPITVSFFIKKSPNKKIAIKNALYYALSIIGIFTLLGFLITFLFGPEALNKLATNWIANLFFFTLFIVFGMSFLGAFEIRLPSQWGNLSNTKSGIGSFSGIFFMALTLVIVSFSCTGPIIGNLIVLAAKGSYLAPLLGMFAFSLALAFPFFIFAMMPGWLNKVSKSGGWLNVIKVSMGFIELALALKFLSNADL
ncbi:MAG: protein-disulfide reductase DsbD family protein, partial [Chitinophagaceae bacterium]